MASHIKAPPPTTATDVCFHFKTVEVEIHLNEALEGTRFEAG